jgi:hypothetical protein
MLRLSASFYLQAAVLSREWWLKRSAKETAQKSLGLCGFTRTIKRVRILT